jgi:hypothetical protein
VGRVFFVAILSIAKYVPRALGGGVIIIEEYL